MAGIGKSTISRIVTQSFIENDQLGISFFFKRDESECGNVSRFFIMIALHLAHKMFTLMSYLRSAIDAEPGISEKSLKQQFKKLIFQPLSQVMQTFVEGNPANCESSTDTWQYRQSIPIPAT